MLSDWNRCQPGSNNGSTGTQKTVSQWKQAAND